MLIDPPIPGIQLFQHLTVKIQGQGHGWGQSWKLQHGSNIQSTHIPFVPCRIPFLSYDFFKIWPWKSRVNSRSWVTSHSSKSQCGSNILSTDIPFVSCRSALPFLRYSIFKIWPWKSRVKVKWPGCCTTTGLLRQFHRTSNGINPSSGFWDMGSAKSGPSAAWFGKFLAHGQALVGQMGKWLWRCTTAGLDKSMNL